MLNSLYGFEVYFDEGLVERTWEFPYDRFIEYGPEDEWWARPRGFGREVVKPKSEAIRIGNALYMHPALWKVLCKYDKTAKENRERAFELPRSGPNKKYVAGYASPGMQDCAFAFGEQRGDHRIVRAVRPSSGDYSQMLETFNIPKQLEITREEVYELGRGPLSTQGGHCHNPSC